MPASVSRARRIRRPAPRFPLTQTYAWRTIAIKVWWPTSGATPPGFDSHAPGL